MNKYLWLSIAFSMSGIIACSAATKDTQTAAIASSEAVEQANDAYIEANDEELTDCEICGSVIPGSVSKEDIQAVSGGGMAKSFVEDNKDSLNKALFSKAAIKAVVRANAEYLKNCYITALKNGKDFKGRIVVEWIVEPNGRTSNITIQESDIDDVDMQQCVIDTVAGMQFEAKNGRAKIVYPFLFKL